MNTQPSKQQGQQSQQAQQDQVQADSLLSQPDPDSEAVAEEISLDQQADNARRVGQLPKDLDAPVRDSLKSGGA